MDIEEWNLLKTRLDPRKPLNPLCCSCSHCNYVLQSTSHWTEIQKSPIEAHVRVGDRVLVQGTYTGTVKYVGDLDSEYTHDNVYVGVKLDDPVGTNDGLYEGKRFFHCPEFHGVVVPIQHVQLLAPRDQPQGNWAENRRSCPTILAQQQHDKRAEKVPKGSPFCVVCANISKTGKKVGRPDNEILQSSKKGEDVDWENESSGNEDRLPSPPPKGVTGSQLLPTPFKYKSSPEIRRRPEVPELPYVKANTSIHSTKTNLSASSLLKPLAKVSFEGMSISSDGSQVSTQSACSHLSKQGLPSQQGTFSETKKQAKERSISPHKQSVFPQAFKHTDSTPKASKVNVPSQVNKQVVSPQVGKLRAHASQQSIQSKIEIDNIFGTPSFRGDPSYHYASSSCSSEALEGPAFSKVQQRMKKKNKEKEDEIRQNFSRYLLSGLSVRDTDTPPLAYNLEIENVKELQELADQWGGGEKGLHMALTLQKLQVARLKGEKELEWQKELHLMDSDSEFTARKRQIESLREEIVGARRQMTLVDTKIQQLQHDLHRSSYFREMSELKQQIQKLQKKNNATLDDLNYHPVANSELVKKTIARITQDYRERKENIEETGHGHPVLQCH